MQKLKNLIYKLRVKLSLWINPVSNVKSCIWFPPKVIPDSIREIIIISTGETVYIGHYSDGEYFTIQTGSYKVLTCKYWTEKP